MARLGRRSNRGKEEIWPGMTRCEFARVCKYTTDLVDILGLWHWAINISQIPCDDSANAQIDICDGRYVATIQISRDWPKMNEKARRNAITHELLHLPLEPAWQMVSRDLRSHLSNEMANLFNSGFRRNAELAIDTYASIVRRFMPTYPGMTRILDGKAHDTFTKDSPLGGA